MGTVWRPTQVSGDVAGGRWTTGALGPQRGDGKGKSGAQTQPQKLSPRFGAVAEISGLLALWPFRLSCHFNHFNDKETTPCSALPLPPACVSVTAGGQARKVVPPLRSHRSSCMTAAREEIELKHVKNIVCTLYISST